VHGQKHECQLNELKKILYNKEEGHEAITDVLRLLSLCHSVIIDPKTQKYNSSSPDESALVDGAAACGYKFHSRDTEKNLVVRIDETKDGEAIDEHYKLLNILEFDSDRKRMSIIVRDQQT